MGNTQSGKNEGPVILAQADFVDAEVATVYTDGDLVDQGEGSYEPEEHRPDLFVIVPGLYFTELGFNSTGGPTGFINEVGETKSGADFDIPANLQYLSLIDGSGNRLAHDDPVAGLLATVSAATRGVMIVDTAAAATNPLALYAEVDCYLINKLMQTPGSRCCFELNLKMTSARFTKVGKVGEAVPVVLAAMQSAMLGKSKNVCLLGSAVADHLFSKFGVDQAPLKRTKSIHTSKAAKRFTRRTWALVRRMPSRIATVKATRVHSAGGYVIQKKDALDVSRQENAVLAKGQAHRDGIVFRAAQLMGLNPDNTKEIEPYYDIMNTVCDGLVVWLDQLAFQSVSNKGSLVREGSTIGSLIAKTGSSTRRSGDTLFPRIGWRLVLPAGDGGETRHFISPALALPMDLACQVRRDGGTPENRSLVRAFEKLLRYGPLGLPLVAGIIPECETIRIAGLSASAAPQLTHCAVAPLLPACARGVYARATSATTKRAIGICIAVTFQFETGRWGQEAMAKQNIVRSEQKAVAKYGGVFGEAALSYGKKFAALNPDSKVYGILLRSATHGVGGLTDDTPEADVKAALEKYMSTFTAPESADEMISIATVIEAGGQARPVDSNLAGLAVPNLNLAPVPGAAAGGGGAGATGVMSQVAGLVSTMFSGGAGGKSPVEEMLVIDAGLMALYTDVAFADVAPEVESAVASEDMDGLKAVIKTVLGSQVVPENFLADFPTLFEPLGVAVREEAQELASYKAFLVAVENGSQGDHEDTKKICDVLKALPANELAAEWAAKVQETAGDYKINDADYAFAFAAAIAAVAVVVKAKGLSRTGLRAQRVQLRESYLVAVNDYAATAGLEVKDLERLEVLLGRVN